MSGSALTCLENRRRRHCHLLSSPLRLILWIYFIIHSFVLLASLYIQYIRLIFRYCWKDLWWIRIVNRLAKMAIYLYILYFLVENVLSNPQYIFIKYENMRNELHVEGRDTVTRSLWTGRQSVLRTYIC